MPVYVYKCPSCRKETPKIRKFKDMDVPFECPICQVTTKRLLFVGSVIGQRNVPNLSKD